jgi:hypothetical protein
MTLRAPIRSKLVRFKLAYSVALVDPASVTPTTTREPPGGRQYRAPPPSYAVAGRAVARLPGDHRSQGESRRRSSPMAAAAIGNACTS